VITVVFKNKDSVPPRGERERYCFFLLEFAYIYAKTFHPETITESRNILAPGENLLSPQGVRVKPLPGPLASKVTQATSYDDTQDSLPTGDVSDKEPGSYDDDDDDDFDVALAPRRGKSKSRARSGFDDEPEDGDGEGYIEAPPIAKLSASYRLRNAGEPSFSIVPSPSKRGTTPSRTSRGLGSFSPVRVRSSLAKSPTYKLTQVASDESP
jgi:hypothetical protein